MDLGQRVVRVIPLAPLPVRVYNAGGLRVDFFPRFFGRSPQGVGVGFARLELSASVGSNGFRLTRAVWIFWLCFLVSGLSRAFLVYFLSVIRI